MKNNGNNDFTKGKISTAILSMAVPMIIAQLVNVAYSIVDRMYIGHMPGNGGLSLSGIGLTAPVISIISAFTMLCGAGGGALCSIERGKGDTEKAERIMGNALSLLLIFAVVLTAVVQFDLDRILLLFGASEATLPYAHSYAVIYISGTVFVMLSLGMNYFINAQGFGKMGMLTVTIGAVINLILDPVFIYVFKLGVAGAAIATVISQACSAVWVMSFLLSKRAILNLRLSSMKLKGSIIRDIVLLGTANFIMNVTNSAIGIAYNTQLRKYGGDVYIGVMTIINSLKEVLIMVVHGVTNGAQPVLGFNYGAGELGRVKNGIKFTVSIVVAYSVLGWIFIMLCPELLVRIFNTEAEFIAAGVPSLRLYFCAFAFLSLQASGQCVFVGLGKAKSAIFFSLFRKIIVELPLILILPLFMKQAGAFVAEPISDVAGGVACILGMYFTIYRKLTVSGGDKPAEALQSPGQQ